MGRVTNPILKGFNPDPSIVRVNDDYYIATSTFEWFPGVQIHHSRDLIHWQVITHPLSRTSQLDLRGTPDSCGVWAPSLSYHDGLYYLIYTDVKSQPIMGGGLQQIMHNYLVTAPDITGPWSEPVKLFSGGYDPDLYIEDERFYIVYAGFDYRRALTLHNRKSSFREAWNIIRRDGKRGLDPFSGIFLQEFNPDTWTPIGSRQLLFAGTGRTVPEGPHIKKHAGYYYLLIAEGGTTYNHCTSLLRSKNLTGPYELDPENPLMSSTTHPDHPIQKAGHADWVTTPDGEWYLVHLMSRPVDKKYSLLGRETALQKVIWQDGWLRLAHGSSQPAAEVGVPDIPRQPWPALHEHDDFDSPQLGIQYQTLRVPLENKTLSLTDRPGHLRLYGAEGVNSLFHQAFVARRITSVTFDATTKVEFEPADYDQAAGLTVWYDRGNFYYLRVTHNEQHGKVLDILSADDELFKMPLTAPISLPSGAVYLKATLDQLSLQFFFSLDGIHWQIVGTTLNAAILCDEHHYPFASRLKSRLTKPLGAMMVGFTGTFVGLCCQDIQGRRPIADFDFLSYRDL